MVTADNDRCYTNFCSCVFDVEEVLLVAAYQGSRHLPTSTASLEHMHPIDAKHWNVVPFWSRSALVYARV